MKRSVTLEHCFRGEETTRRRKTPRWILCSFKERRRNYMKGKIYLKQLLLKDKFAVKRYSNELLVQIKEEEVYKIITNKAFIDHEDSPFEKIGPHKKFNTQWGTVYSRDLAEFKNEEIM